MTALQRLRSHLAEGLADGAFGGAQLALSWRGELAQVCLGEAAPGRPMTCDHLLPWLSAGKPLTAIAWAQMWEQGRVGLDEPVSQQLPGFSERGKQAITYRHLLTHTGGFRSLVDVDGSGDWEAEVNRVCNARLERNWVPGHRAGYQARGSWYVLGEVVQRLAGQPLADYVRDQICRPAGMDDSWLAMTPTDYAAYGERIAQVCDTSRQRLPDAPLEPELFSNEAATTTVPGTSARGPMRDLCRLYEVLLRQPEKLLQEPTLAAMVSRQRSGLFDETFRHTLDWGLGFVLDSNQHGAETVPYGYGRHASRRTFGHAGARCVTGFADPQNDLCVALGVNGRLAPAAHVNQFREFLSAIYEDLALTGEHVDNKSKEG